MSSDSKYKLEYIWLDGYLPEPKLAAKPKSLICARNSVSDLAIWGFDGSSTQQAEGHSSDCVLKPVSFYPDSTRKNGFLVMREVLLPDMKPHPSNYRSTVEDVEDLWIGFEQEYFFYENGRPLGFPGDGFLFPKARTTPVSATKTSGDIARQVVEEHIDITLDAGINIEGINAEVAKGQWEFQIFAKGSKKVCDDMWVARYLLFRLAEKYGLDVELYCKPIKGDWNGSGTHTNFSTKILRETGGKEYFEKLMAAFEKYRDEHIQAYGPDNHLRLTGLHETQSIDKFNWGVANRGASIRVPHSFVNNNYKGYLEDRLTNSQAIDIRSPRES